MDSMKATRWAAAMALGVIAATAPNAAAELKVAVVNTGQAIQQSLEAQAYMEKVEQELDPEQTELRALQDEIQALQQQVADEGDVMSDAARRGIAKDIENKTIDLEFRVQKLNKDVQDRRDELLRMVGPKVQAVVSDMVEVERYDLVFERGSVGYVNPRHDITAKVTEKLNERFTEGSGAEGGGAQDAQE